MIATAAPTRYTIDEFLTLPDHKNFELIDGELVEINVSNLSSWVAVKVASRLEPYCRTQALGEVFGADTLYQCFPDRPNRVRKPDVSFIRESRLPSDWLADGYFTIPPDLAVEVISPNDINYKVDRKIQEFLNAGVRLVWEINPEQRIAFVHRVDGTGTKLMESGSLCGEDVVPGFSCPLSEIFPPKPVKA